MASLDVNAVSAISGIDFSTARPNPIDQDGITFASLRRLAETRIASGTDARPVITNGYAPLNLLRDEDQVDLSIEARNYLNGSGQQPTGEETSSVGISGDVSYANNFRTQAQAYYNTIALWQQAQMPNSYEMQLAGTRAATNMQLRRRPDELV